MTVIDSDDLDLGGWLVGAAAALMWAIFLEEINHRLFCEISILNALSFYVAGTIGLCALPVLSRWANHVWSRRALQMAPIFLVSIHWFELALERDGISRLTGYLVWKPLVVVLGPACIAAGAFWLYNTHRRRAAFGVRVLFGFTFWFLGYVLVGTYVKLASASWLLSGLFLFTHPIPVNDFKRVSIIIACLALPLFWVSKLRATFNTRAICSPLYWSIETAGRHLLRIDDSQDKHFIPDRDRQRELAARYSRAKGGAQRDVKNVLLIVLESIRWDSWANDALTPEFHKWKTHGLYVPNAVAQYPATPLAYGAMFTSQTPSVLVQTPKWKAYRPMDMLRDRFDSFFLSRPKNRWFDDDAIISFISNHRDVETHLSAREGLERLTHFYKSKPTESKFAWIHLYEPHRPWQGRPEFMSSDAPSKKEKYESEIRFIDKQLGAFMDWFYSQDISKDTLVIVLADHGQGVGETLDERPFYGHHVYVKTNVSWVPFYISGPGIKPDQVRMNLPVAQLDIMPTVFDFIGQKLPVELLPQGMSVRAVLKNQADRVLITEAFSIRGTDFFRLINTSQMLTPKTAQEKFKIVSRAGRYPPKIGLQFGTLKLIHNQLTGKSSLFDLEKGQLEVDELTNSDQIRLKLQTELDRWREEQAWIIKSLPFRPDRTL